MKRKTISIVVCLTLVLTAFVITPLNVSAATDIDIEDAIAAGVAWLAGVQNPDGSWGAYALEAMTGLVLLKLQDRAYELGKDPFEIDLGEPDYYEYASNVIDGWKYLFTPSGANDGMYVKKQTISLQDHTGGASGSIDDPDTRVNGYGIRFGISSYTYSTGICLMALVASGTPGRVNDGGIDYDVDGFADTFGEIAQDVVDWLAFAQGDLENDEGGYYYEALDNAGGSTDNSNTGYAYLGLAAAESTTAKLGATPFACTIPGWVKTELNVWINTIQDPVDGDADDGGSYYNPDWLPFDPWVNELKTGNLIFQMTFYGDSDADARFQNALDYIERHWQDNNVDPGWGYNLDPANYQAMFCLMKGLEYSGINQIDTDGDNVRDDDWFNQEPPMVPAQDFASVLVAQQDKTTPSFIGSWPTCSWSDAGRILSTAWALLTLEKITPPPPAIDVNVDIKPGSCPNPINLKGNGVLPVAICGTDDFDVTTIDPGTILITREGYEDEGVSPLRWNYEDVATPYTGEEECGCHDLNGDGLLDLTLKFNKKEVVNTLELEDVEGATIPLIITGNLIEEEGGTPFNGQDCVWILEHKEETKDKSFINTNPIYQLVEQFLQRFPLLRLLLSYLIF